MYPHTDRGTKPSIAEIAVSGRVPCYCSAVRQAARRISRQYAQALRPARVTVAQFTVLTLLRHKPGSGMGELADALGTDRTSVSRIIAVLRRDGLIGLERSEDRRERRWGLTVAGRSRLEVAFPLYKAAQHRIESQLGSQAARQLRELSFALTVSLA